MTHAALIDPLRVRQDFSLLAPTEGGARLVYLDSAATSQKPNAVLEAMDDYYRCANANVHRGVYRLAQEATERFEDGRRAVAELVTAPLPGTIFTKNATEAINLVAWAWGLRTLRPHDVVMVTEMEHHSGIVPWQIVAKMTGAEVRFAPITPEGELDHEWIDHTLASAPVRMVSIVHVSNVLGTINPVTDIVARAHAHGALVLVDASQSVPHMPVSFADIGCDFMAFTGHKMLGPTGIGVLVGRPELLDEMEPFLGGGEMIADVRTDGSDWADLPSKFEAGTPPIAESVGLGAACAYLSSLGLDAVRAHEVHLTAYALDALSEIEGLRIFGPRDPARRGGAISFHLPDLHPHDIAQLVDADNICVRAGHHCAKPLMRALGVNATARASTYIYNDTGDIDAFVTALHRARAYFAG